MELVSASQMRELDRLMIEEFGTPGHVLMERAGEGACAMLLRVFPHIRKKAARVVVFAGKGNNGGDGLVIARLLRKRGVKTSVFLLCRCEEVGGDARRNLDAYQRGRSKVKEVTDAAALAVVAPEVEKAGCVVDALLGTGLRSDVSGLYADAIEMMNACGVPVFSVDIPSGLDADSGRPLGVAVQAEATATFGFAKVGQVVHPGVRHCGSLDIIDIGIAEGAVERCPPRGLLLGATALKPLLPSREDDAHKGIAGHLLVIAGSQGKAGASILATRAGLRGGAGLVTLAGPRSINSICAGAAHEAMTEAWPERAGEIAFDPDRLATAVEGKAAVVAGPGLGTAPAVRRLVTALLRQGTAPLVLDADALNVLAVDLAPLRRAQADVVLTPHPGEMARLAGIDAAAVQVDRVGVACAFAEKHECVVVLKGARTVVADADGFFWINPSGNCGMASGGMGDVLAGVIGALLAQGMPAAEAACCGVYIHGLAGDLAAESGSIGILASDLVDALPRASALVRESPPES